MSESDREFLCFQQNSFQQAHFTKAWSFGYPLFLRRNRSQGVSHVVYTGCPFFLQWPKFWIHHRNLKSPVRTSIPSFHLPQCPIDCYCRWSGFNFQFIQLFVRSVCWSEREGVSETGIPVLIFERHFNFIIFFKRKQNKNNCQCERVCD